MNASAKSAIGRMIQVAQQESAADSIRATYLERYLGEPYGDEKDKRSQFISTDVSDVVDGVLANVMEVFTSAEDIVKFQPVGPEDEDAARQETDVVSHVFWQMNNGFLTLYTWFKEAFIQQNSYVKSGWVERERTTVEEYADLEPAELQMVLSQIEGDIEPLEYEGLDENGAPIPEGVDMQTGAQRFRPIRVKLRITKFDQRYEIKCIPNEEIFLTPRWPSLDLTGIPVCGHRRMVEIGELREMGFSEETIRKAADQHREDYLEETRNNTRDVEEGDHADDGDESVREVMVYEAYVRADIDGDGRAEQLKVWAIGDGSTIMQWEDGTDAIEEVSHHPFSALTPNIVPHRHVGRSLSEQVDDIAQIKTTIYRMNLDNLYNTVYRRPYFDENMAGEHLLSDLMSPAPGAAIRTGGADVAWMEPSDISPITMPLVDRFDQLKEQRTGNLRYNQGLDSESLNPLAKETVGRVMDAGQKPHLLIARVFAETGLRDLFLRIHRDLRSGPMRELAIKLRNKWTQINPRTWRERTDMTVEVGMGSGDRNMKRQGLMLIAQAQEKMMASGLKMVGPQQLFNTAERLGETFGFESIDEFFLNPEMQPQGQEKPDPAQQMAQMQAQMAQMQMQVQQQKLQLEAEKLRIEREKLQRETGEASADQVREQQEQARKQMQTAAQIQAEQQRLALDRDRAVMDDDFRRDKLAVDAQSAHMRKFATEGTTSPPMRYSSVGN